MGAYSYAECLTNSYRMNWKVSDVIGGRRFDASRPWLPARLSGAGRIACLTGAEKVKLSHVEMGAHAHLLGYVEEFIAPTMLTLAREHAIDRREAFDALTNFDAEEVKHITLITGRNSVCSATVSAAAASPARAACAAMASAA